MKMNMKEIVTRINYFRNEKNLSGAELSGRIGKNQDYINALSSKYFNLPVPVLMDILEVLEISPVEFFADNYRTYKLDNHLYDTLLKMSKDKKESLLKFIENE